MLPDFFATVAGLKETPRRGWVDKLCIRNPESVADHSYMTALISMVMADSLGLDSARVVRMALLHDVAESITGDHTPESAGREEKSAAESAAMTRILGMLPDDAASRYGRIWREYEDGRTPESRLVHECDKLEMALQAHIYMAARDKTDAGEFLESARRFIRNPELVQILSGLGDACKKGRDGRTGS